MGESRLYVIGESGDDRGPVKIGLTAKKQIAGLNRGNWRALIELGHVEEDPQVVRWREWLTHRRLRHLHVRGEWFDVRALAAGGDWASLLERVWTGTEPGARQFELGIDGHKALLVWRLSTGNKRHFRVECSCGDPFDLGTGKAMPTVLRRYVLEHLRQPKDSPLLAEIAHETHHSGYTINPYSER